MNAAGPQPPESREQFAMPRDGHASERIFEAGPTAAAYLVSVSINREDATQLGMVTPESSVQCARQGLRNRLPQRNFVRRHDIHLPRQLFLSFSSAILIEP
jgi:hypothetical protein